MLAQSTATVDRTGHASTCKLHTSCINYTPLPLVNEGNVRGDQGHGERVTTLTRSTSAVCDYTVDAQLYIYIYTMLIPMGKIWVSYFVMTLLG